MEVVSVLGVSVPRFRVPSVDEKGKATRTVLVLKESLKDLLVKCSQGMDAKIPHVLFQQASVALETVASVQAPPLVIADLKRANFVALTARNDSCKAVSPLELMERLALSYPAQRSSM